MHASKMEFLPRGSSHPPSSPGKHGLQLALYSETDPSFGSFSVFCLSNSRTIKADPVLNDAHFKAQLLSELFLYEDVVDVGELDQLRHRRWTCDIDWSVGGGVGDFGAILLRMQAHAVTPCNTETRILVMALK
jgi:hypothetical protein